MLCRMLCSSFKLPKLARLVKVLVTLTTFVFCQLLAVVLYVQLASKDAVYTEWSSWSKCPAYCGESFVTRSRNCSVENEWLGQTCAEIGTAFEIKTCLNKHCPINGGPGWWTNWRACDRKCIDGTRHRVRMCNNPMTQYSGVPCKESDLLQVLPCDITTPCPVEGKYGEWEAWGTCSKTCSPAVKTRRRTCVRATSNVKACVGPAKESKSCDLTVVCPVDRKYGLWAAWNACSVTCGSGVRGRNRECKPPIGSGKPCKPGSTSEKGTCKLQACKKI